MAFGNHNTAHDPKQSALSAAAAGGTHLSRSLRSGRDDCQLAQIPVRSRLVGGGRRIRTSGSARDKASVRRFLFRPPSRMPTDGSRGSSSDGGIQPKPAIIALGRACMERGTGVRIHFPPAASQQRNVPLPATCSFSERCGTSSNGRRHRGDNRSSHIHQPGCNFR
jgi:hypothetical protein